MTPMCPQGKHVMTEANTYRAPSDPHIARCRACRRIGQFQMRRRTGGLVIEPEVTLVKRSDVPQNYRVACGFWRSVLRRTLLIAPGEALEIDWTGQPYQFSESMISRAAREEGVRIGWKCMDSRAWIWWTRRPK